MKTLVEKRCNTCNKTKPIERFSKKSSCKDGYSTKCKDCHNKYVREVWYKKNADKQKDSARKWKARNKDKVLATRHNVPLESIQKVKLLDDGQCAICGSCKDLCSDHCHITSIARGILCRACNTKLGILGDNLENITDFFDKASSYLKRSL